MAQEKNLAVNALLNGIRVISNMLLPLISLPYLTRVLQAEGYGKVGFCNSIISYFVLISGLGISNYAIREGARIRDDNSKLSSFSLEILGIHIVSTFVAYIIFFVVLILWKPSNDYIRIFLALSPMIVSGVLGFEWLPNIMEDFFYITIRGIAIQIISLILILLFVKNSNDYLVYALIMGGSSFCTACINFAYARKHISIKLHEIILNKRHIKPIFVLFANTLMITIYLHSDITMLGLLRNDTSVGLYKVSVQIYSMIKTFINAVTVVAIPRLSLYISKGDKKAYNETASNIVQALVCISIPCITGLILIADNCVLIVGGQGYIGSVASLRVLCFALIFAVLGNFFANAVLVVNRKEKESLIATVISAMVNIGLNIIMIPKYDLLGAAITTLIAEIMVSCLLMFFSREYISLRLNYKMMIPIAGSVILICLICQVIDRFEMGLFLDTVFKIGLSATAYGGIMIISQKILKIQLVLRRGQ